MIEENARTAISALGSMAQVKLAMQRVALIYNPVSGQYSSRRDSAVHDALGVLRAAGIAADLFETSEPTGATAHTQEAVRRGCDTVLACGGDGTVHAILQSLVGTQVALGVIPLGTANALAADLGLLGSPAKVAGMLLHAMPVRVPVGRIYFHDRAGNPASRSFLVAAGVGADALLMSRMDARLKRRLGYILYMIEAFRVWAGGSFPLFEAAFTATGSPAPRLIQASQLLVVRVRSFGGALRELVPGATLHSSSLNMLAFRTQSRRRLLRFLLAVLFRRHTFRSEIELLEAASIQCHALNGSTAPVFVEADGEVLGSLPVRIEVVPDALTLLIPPNAQP